MKIVACISDHESTLYPVGYDHSLPPPIAFVLYVIAVTRGGSVSWAVNKSFSLAGRYLLTALVYLLVSVWLMGAEKDRGKRQKKRCRQVIGKT